MASTPERELFERFAGSVAYVSVESPDGTNNMGTCFHIGDGIFITAKHVVEGNKVIKVSNTPVGIQSAGGEGLTMNYILGHAKAISGFYYHPEDNYDLCAFYTPDICCLGIPLGPIIDDHFGNDLMLSSVVVMGFPRVYASREPVLVCVKGEVNAAISCYLQKQRVYVISCLARGGFSGGPVLATPNRCVGLITSSLLAGELPAELGFMAVVECRPIYELLAHNNIMPELLKPEWQAHLAREKEREEREEVDNFWHEYLEERKPQ